MKDSPASVICDENGNPVGIVLDGSVYRLQSDSKIGETSGGNLKHLQVTDNGLLKNLRVDGLGNVIGGPIQITDPAKIYCDFCKNGTSKDLTVDGSSSNVNFIYRTDVDHDLILNSICFVGVAESIKFGVSDFGTRDVLSNGLSVYINYNENETLLTTLKENEDFMHFADSNGFDMIYGLKDIVHSNLNFYSAIELSSGGRDGVKVKVQDDLTNAFDYFTCFVKGCKV